MSENKLNVYQKLNKIQTELKAPKNQYNSFGKYNYRSLEDITEAIKPLLEKYRCVLHLSDDLIIIGDRYYIRSESYICDIDTEETTRPVYGYARESENKKGMDESQITGSTSSYARKYSLNALFCIDDTKDSDATNTHGIETKNINNNRKQNVNELINKKRAEINKLIKERNINVEFMTEMFETLNNHKYDKNNINDVNEILVMCQNYNHEEINANLESKE